MTTTSTASTNPFAAGLQENKSKEETQALSANHSTDERGAINKQEANAMTMPEQKEETKPFLPSSEPKSTNEKPTSPDLANEKPAPLTPMFTRPFKKVKQTAYNLILKLPNPDATIVFLMVVDLAAVIVLLVWDNTSGTVSFTELLFYVASLVATVLGVLYLCGTKTPRDMSRLFDRNKSLLNEYGELNVKHTEALALQKEEVQAQKRETDRLSSTVVTFREENVVLNQNVNELKSITEYIAENSVQQLEEIGEQIAELQGLNIKFSEQIEEVNMDIQIMEKATRQTEVNTRVQMATVENMKELNVRAKRSLEKQNETTQQLNEIVRVADLKDDLAEIPNVPSLDTVEETGLDIKTKPQVVEEQV